MFTLFPEMNRIFVLLFYIDIKVTKIGDGQKWMKWRQERDDLYYIGYSPAIPIFFFERKYANSQVPQSQFYSGDISLD